MIQDQAKQAPTVDPLILNMQAHFYVSHFRITRLECRKYVRPQMSVVRLMVPDVKPQMHVQNMLVTVCKGASNLSTSINK